jgi:hypothetical protein
MSTRTLIDRLEPWCSGWNRSTGKKSLLHVIQVAIDKLYSDDDSDRFVFRGVDNKGFPPYLKTVAGVYRYNVASESLSCGQIQRSIGGTNYNLVAKQVRRIFIDASASARDYFGYASPPRLYIQNPYGASTSRIHVIDISVTSQPGYADSNQPPILDFPFDPGTFNDKYFIEFTYGPPRLLSESIPLPVPEEFIDDIEQFAIGYCQARESGRLMNDQLQYFENVVRPKFVNKMTSGATLINNETTPRLC